MGRVTRGQGIAAIVFGVFEIIMGIVIIICGFVIKDFFNPLKASLIVGFITLAGLVIGPGMFGIHTGLTKDNGSMKAFLVSNIVACIILTAGSVTMCIVLVQYPLLLTDITTNCIGDYCNALTTLAVERWTIVVPSFLPVVITFASSILGCVSICCTPAERNDLILQEYPYPVAVVGFPEPPQFQTPEYPGTVGGFTKLPPYQVPEVVELPEIDVKSGNF